MSLITIEFPGLARVDGSAQFTFDPSTSASSSSSSSPITIVSTCSGPMEIPPPLSSSSNPSQSTLQIQVRPLSHIPATSEKYISGLLYSALIGSIRLGDNPRTLIQVIVQSLTSLGATGSGEMVSAGRGEVLPSWKWTYVAVMINACTLALLDAGSIPMRGVVCAVPIAVVGGEVVAHPSLEQDKGTLYGCFAYMFGDEEDKPACVFSQWSSLKGSATEARGSQDFESLLEQARDVGEEAARAVWREMRDSRARAAGLDVEPRTDTEDIDQDAKMEI